MQVLRYSSDRTQFRYNAYDDHIYIYYGPDFEEVKTKESFIGMYNAFKKIIQTLRNLSEYVDVRYYDVIFDPVAEEISLVYDYGLARAELSLNYEGKITNLQFTYNDEGTFVNAINRIGFMIKILEKMLSFKGERELEQHVGRILEKAARFKKLSVYHDTLQRAYLIDYGRYYILTKRPIDFILHERRPEHVPIKTKNVKLVLDEECKPIGIHVRSFMVSLDRIDEKMPLLYNEDPKSLRVILNDIAKVIASTANETLIKKFGRYLEKYESLLSEVERSTSDLKTAFEHKTS